MIRPAHIIQIYRSYNLGPGDSVVINGGEPTLYRHLELVVREAAIRGARVILFTNGRLLCHPSRARAWLEAGVYRLSIPLHGSRADTHDMLTRRAGSFAQTIAGIHNAVSLQAETGFPREIELKVLAVRDSLVEWPEIIDLIAREYGSPDILAMSGLNMWSTATGLYARLAPTLDQMQRFVNAALERAAVHRMSVSLWSIPLCLLTPENRQQFVTPIGRAENPARVRVIYFDPQHTEGVEYPDNEFSPYKDVEPECRECPLAQTCGPGRVFMQQLLAVST